MKRILCPLILITWFSCLYSASAFYDPNIGRWVNRDPLGEAGFEFLSQANDENGGINLYGFVGNDSINWIDPYGLKLYPGDFIGPLQPGDSRATYSYPEPGWPAFRDFWDKWIDPPPPPGGFIGMCPAPSLSRGNPPIGKPGRIKQGREINEGKRKNPNWQPRGPQRPLKPHTPSRRD